MKLQTKVWKDISAVEYRRQVYLRQRSYASAPPSHIGILLNEHQNDADLNTEGGIRISTLSEPLCYAQRSTSEYFVSCKKKVFRNFLRFFFSL